MEGRTTTSWVICSRRPNQLNQVSRMKRHLNNGQNFRRTIDVDMLDVIDWGLEGPCRADEITFAPMRTSLRKLMLVITTSTRFLRTPSQLPSHLQGNASFEWRELIVPRTHNYRKSHSESLKPTIILWPSHKISHLVPRQRNQ